MLDWSFPESLYLHMKKAQNKWIFLRYLFINYYTYENRFTLDKVAPLLEVGFLHCLQFACKNKLESTMIMLMK